MTNQNKPKPRLISFMNYGSTIEIKVQIKSKDYIFLLEPSKWSLGLQFKKHFNFKDVNKIKTIGRLVSTIE